MFLLCISKTSVLSQKFVNTAFLSQNFINTRSSIASKDLLDSSIAPHIMPHYPEKHLKLFIALRILSGASSQDEAPGVDTSVLPGVELVETSVLPRVELVEDWT